MKFDLEDFMWLVAILAAGGALIVFLTLQGRGCTERQMECREKLTGECLARGGTECSMTARAACAENVR